MSTPTLWITTAIGCLRSIIVLHGRHSVSNHRHLYYFQKLIQANAKENANAQHCWFFMRRKHRWSAYFGSQLVAHHLTLNGKSSRWAAPHGASTMTSWYGNVFRITWLLTICEGNTLESTDRCISPQKASNAAFWFLLVVRRVDQTIEQSSCRWFEAPWRSREPAKHNVT